MKVKQDQQRKGFTIIEVVLVLAIAGLIFLIVFLAVPALQRSQRDTQRRNDVSRLMSQLSQYQSNNGGDVPSETGTGTTTISSFVTRYLTNGGTEQFDDPTTGSTYNVSGNHANSDEPPVGSIYYYVGARCSGESVQDSSGNRKVAVTTKLEGGAVFCQDNT